MLSQDLGAALFKTWTDEQRRDEIRKLVEGYRAGLSLGILCKMAETIAGSQEKAREHLVSLMPPSERQAAVEKETGGMRILAIAFLL
jgi:hypothetical protein